MGISAEIHEVALTSTASQSNLEMLVFELIDVCSLKKYQSKMQMQFVYPWSRKSAR